MTPEQRRNDDNRIVRSADEARQAFCSGGAAGWPKFQRLVRITYDPICCRCGGAIDTNLPGTDPMGWTVDHLDVQVSDTVGWRKGDARAALQDINTVRPAHRIHNTQAGHGIGSHAPVLTSRRGGGAGHGGRSPVIWTREQRRRISDAMLGMGEFRGMASDERARISADLVAEANAA